MGPSFTSNAYLLKKLDHSFQGWAPCLQALAIAEILICESKNLTFESLITVFLLHVPPSNVQGFPNTTLLLGLGNIGRGHNTYLSAMSTS